MNITVRETSLEATLEGQIEALVAVRKTAIPEQLSRKTWKEESLLYLD